jgi:hypothetical protein
MSENFLALARGFMQFTECTWQVFLRFQDSNGFEGSAVPPPTQHKCRVPHPRGVFVFAARVGTTNTQLPRIQAEKRIPEGCSKIARDASPGRTPNLQQKPRQGRPNPATTAPREST